MRFAIWLKTLYNTRIKQLNREQNMLKVTKFTGKSVTDLENEIVRVLKAAKIKGVTFSGNTRSYGSNETTFKIVAQLEGTQSKEDAGLEAYCKFEGIDPTKPGKKGERITGYRPRATKHPLIYTTVRGAQYITDARRWKARHEA
jgi:hypothetical protein